VSSQLAAEPLAVRSEHLAIAEETVQRAQLELRAMIESLRADDLQPMVSVAMLAHRLADVRRTIGSAWRATIDVHVTGGRDLLDGDIAEDTVDIVQEAATNAVRHGGASVVTVDANLGPEAIGIVVVDNGRGFGMYGRYDLEALLELNAGPAIVCERVALLDGTLVLVSTPEGSRLEIEYATRH